MERRPAKVLEPQDVLRLLRHVRHQRYPERNRVIILLSVKAGLRAGEIAGLEWPMVLGSDQCVADLITIARGIAKGGVGRQIPLHADLKKALRVLHRVECKPTVGPLIRSERGSGFTAASMVNWFGRTYRQLSLVGCSSHSGRRTFITKAARVLAKTGGSLRDIQELAGHAALTTTEKYIEGDRVAQRKLISLL